MRECQRKAGNVMQSDISLFPFHNAQGQKQNTSGLVYRRKWQALTGRGGF